MTREELVEQACLLSGLTDFGDVPYLEPLDVLVYSLNHDAHVEGVTRERAIEMLTGVLVKRLRLVEDRKRHTEIEAEVVRAPIFIVGQPRSGSTHLHALMACVDGLRAPLFWEMSAPSPPPDRATFDADPRIAIIQQIVDGLPEGLMVRHPMSATRPEQCNLLSDWSFINQAWMASFDIPTYREWFLDADYRPAYEAHRRTLQHLQWRNPGRWVLKYPKHLLSLDALLDTYPDAAFIWTHRDPAAVIPSAVSLTGFMRQSNTPDFDPVRFGREWAVIEELALYRGLATRDSGRYPAERNTDVHYPALMADPVGMTARICAQVAAPFSESSSDAVRQWFEGHPKDAHGTHRYSADDFGLDAGRLRSRFGFYIERFGIAAEAERQRVSPS
jgi:Sulfotransferase family